MARKILFLILFLSLIGVVDSGYLTYEHYAKTIPPCSTNIFVDCGKVLNSPYSLFFGIPLALIGLIYYSILFFIVLYSLFTNKKIFKYFIVTLSTVGAFASIYFMYLQLVIVRSICLYCTFSALISFIIFALAMIFLRKEKRELIFIVFGFFYRNFLLKIFFLIDPEIIHERMTANGEFIGKIIPVRYLLKRITRFRTKSLGQKIAGLDFEYPVGFAAGFDYQAQLPQIAPALGFGFQTIGTITNLAYEGNPKPRLGRLPKSKSLMVNKGFKNKGASEVIRKLSNLVIKDFEIPIGVSIGRSNSAMLPTLKQSIQDITESFKKFERSSVKHSYYELNISCPNIIHGSNVSFYPPKNLSQLLSAVQKIKIKKPIFIKMPIELSDRDILNILNVVIKYKIPGVIIGNLQKNKNDPALVKEEVKKWKVGNFSGKPTFNRSNELIKLTYKKFGKKFIIIGCGGIFSAKDAYTKIKLGASLVQLITGMIYQGPQLIPQINLGLIDFLEQDGFKNIKDAIGVNNV
ncbi:dihydroorotate dehydrogenase (quinone) [Candidatus Roizmanbacteria bacterium RIFCSPHIGHO2_01_FULL_37_16]|nr:MAG: dihydroorotate dehydrogenase (quinone) [Candidatus Roizmanbacteria bacterium RIFCSPHIGHO2_01_FULL_37_16]OGK26045.1 MAG: dihydroorotate dehydrogenase (quinone) [Candidatus Roizmanbacteria bacterium RIFCSPHIGHO2_02_FULL_37_9b]